MFIDLSKVVSLYITAINTHTDTRLKSESEKKKIKIEKHTTPSTVTNVYEQQWKKKIFFLHFKIKKYHNYNFLFD